MRLTPQHAPLYGECRLTVQLDDTDAGEEGGEEVEFYLLFSGSTQRHVSSTVRVSHLTLQAVCPAHNVCEQVLVTLCVACPGKPVATHSEEAFCYVQDLALDMAHFLLDTTAPQEALLLDDEQIPLKECERLDQSLALALKHLSLSHHRTAPQTPSPTCAPDTDTQKEASAVSRCQQLSSLLLLAASHGLRTVASFLLQQQGAREALRTANAQGQTPVCVAQGKGHAQLVELFTQYETSSDGLVEPTDQLLWHQEGRLFQHHAEHSAYTLTFCLQQVEAEARTERGDSYAVQEVEELRRLIQLHRNIKRGACAFTTTAIHVGLEGDLQLCSSRQHDGRPDASLAVLNTENCSITAERHGSPRCLTERSFSATPEAVGGQRRTTATKSPAGRKRKNKKRTTKTTRRATAGNSRSTLEASQVDAQGLSEMTARCCLADTEGRVSLKDLAVRSIVSEGTVETPLPIKPVSALADDGTCTGRKATTTITEKQEREKWEVDALMCEEAVENETEPAVNQSPSTRRAEFVKSAEHRADTMGQEQSQESQSESEEPRQPGSASKPRSDSSTSPKSPGMEGKPCKTLWQEGGWLGSIMGSPSLGSDTAAKTVWHQGENMEQGVSEESSRKEVISQTVWYDVDEQTHKQLKQTKWDLPEKLDKSPSQLLEQGLSSHQECSALSQPHAAGAQPAPSHVLATQRQEVQGSRREEEVGPDWQEGGEEAGSEVWNRETTHSRKNSETAELEEWGEEKPGEEEREAKGRKKRRRKKGKTRGSEAKLSSSSSIESHNQHETQTEQGTNLNRQSETESEANDQTGRAPVHSPTISEPTRVGEEADKDAMHLPSETESQTRGSHKPGCTSPANHGGTDQAEPMLSQTQTKESVGESVRIPGSDHLNLHSTVATSELDDTIIKKADAEEMNPGQPKGKDVLFPTELDLEGSTSPTVDDMESQALSQHESRTVAVASGDQTGLMESKFPKELPVKITEPTELTEDLLLVVFPEENKLNVQSEDSNKPVQPVNPMEKPSGFVDSVHPFKARPCEGTADVRPLEIQEGSPETTAREYLEHCLSSEMLRDLQLKEENRPELREGKEEDKDTGRRRPSEERDCRVMDTELLSSVEQRLNLESPSLEREHLQRSDDDLVITAVAVVTVAIASAMARVELSQQLASNLPVSPAGSSLPAIVQDANVASDKRASDQFDSEAQAQASVSEPKTETLGLTLVHIEEIQPETAPNNVFPCPLSDDPELPQVNTSPLPETHDRITAEVDGQSHMQLQIQPPCPPIDTGQQSGSDAAAACPASKSEPQDQPACQTQRDGQSALRVQSTEVCPASRAGVVPAEFVTGEAGGQGPEHEQGGPGSSESKTVQDEERESGHRWEEILHDAEIHTLPLLHSPVPPGVLCHSPPVTEPSPEQPPAAAATESVDLQPCQSPEDSKPVECQSEGNEPIAVDDVCDTDSQDLVDGWKHREREKLELVEEARKDTFTVQDTPQKAAEIGPPPGGESGQARLPDSTDTEQIRREKDLCYPVQPRPQPSTETSCIGGHPGRDDGVSVGVLQKDCERLQVSSDQDDGVFKKPFPPSCAGHGDKGVRVSADESIQADISPSEGASSSLSHTANTGGSERKPETQTTGGGVAEGRGRAEKDENKAQLSGNPISSAILRASLRSMSPLRRHSWEPGPSSACKDADLTQHSSLKSRPGEARRAKPPLHRRSMSWCPSNLWHPDQQQIDNRSYSLERLEVQRGSPQSQCPSLSDQEERTAGRSLHLDSQERGSLISLTEEEQEGDGISIDSQASSEGLPVTSSCPAMFHHQTLTKSVSMVTISHRNIDGLSPFSSNASTLEYSISEEEPGPLRSETEGKVQGPKISRTFSYLRSKMSKKVKEKEKRGDKEREKEKKTNGHVFISVSLSPSTACQHCTKLLHKEAFLCSSCGVHAHKSCRESLSVCTKSKTKQQLMVPDAGPGIAVNMRSKTASSASSVSSTLPSPLGERWSTLPIPDDQFSAFPWRPSNILSSHSNLSKSVSISNIAGLDDAPLKGLKFLSQSTDNLHQGSKVNASTESLTDEGTEMMDSQLMGEFECDVKDLEADSWSGTVDKKFLKTLKKDEIKRQDVIYELFQTEFHHVRTLKIMFEVYYKGLQKETQLDTHTLDKVFPVVDNLLDIHTQFLSRLLETKRASSAEGRNSLLIGRIGDILVTQFSDANADLMKKAYGKFCSRHNEAVNLYKDLHAKDKRFQAFIKKTMSSSIVRRLSIPECILLVTQRITKYPVLMQRILQHTRDSDEDHSLLCEALRCIKELITAVDSKVNEHEKKCRLREVYSRTDSKSIMRMKSGQMFAKEDLIRGRKLLHDGALQLKNSAGRLKDVHAMLLSDVLVFLQEKDQKYVFASLDQRSTVMSIQNLIVREVANEDRGLFLITAGTDRPEMVEVLASSKEERNSWRAVIQDAMHCMEKDEDEGVPSETEEDRKQQENRAREIRELLQRKDKQIISLLEEKVRIFRDLSDCPAPEDVCPPVRERMLFRATPDDVTRGEPIIKDAIREVESLHTLVSRGVGGAGCSAPADLTGGSVGPVCLPRRAETFGGFDSHQMNSSKNGEKEEGDESLDLRRTESDSLLKKGAAASLQMLLKKNNEQVQQSVSHLHDLLISLQAIVVQQDSFIEDQRQALNDRLTANCSRHSSSSSLSSSSSSRPSSLIEQEKHRSLERQRQEAASLQKQQAAYQEERRRREKEWELKERSLGEWEERLREGEEETRKKNQELVEERELLQRNKDEFQREVERLREAQRKLERDKETLKRDTEQLEAKRNHESEQLQRYQRTPSSTSEESLRFHSSGSLDVDSKEAAELKEVELSSSAPTKEPFLRIGSKRISKNFNPFSSSSSSKPQGAEKELQLPTRLLQLTKPKEKKDKKKKKGKAAEQAQTEAKSTVMVDPQNDGDIFFC